MEIKKIVVQEFDSFVNENFKNENIKNFLIKHERKHILVDRLTKQIYDASNVLLAMSKPMDEKRAIIRALSKDFAAFFCKTALDVKEAEFVSNIKRIGDINNDDDEKIILG